MKSVFVTIFVNIENQFLFADILQEPNKIVCAEFEGRYLYFRAETPIESGVFMQNLMRVPRTWKSAVFNKPNSMLTNIIEESAKSERFPENPIISNILFEFNPYKDGVL
jgi:hypothetical protein